MCENDYVQKLRETTKKLIDAVQDIDLLDLVYKLLIADVQK
jgi:hypothetical protein